MNLFDEKVVTAMLIDAITGCLKNNGDISLTFQMQFMQEMHLQEQISTSSYVQIIIILEL